MKSIFFFRNGRTRMFRTFMIKGISGLTAMSILISNVAAQVKVEPGRATCASDVTTPYDPLNPPLLDPYFQSDFGNFGATVIVLLPKLSSLVHDDKPYHAIYYNSVNAAALSRFNMTLRESFRGDWDILYDASELWRAVTPHFVQLTDGATDEVSGLLVSPNGNRILMKKDGENYRFPNGFLEIKKDKYGLVERTLHYQGGARVYLSRSSGDLVNHEGVRQTQNTFTGEAYLALDGSEFETNNKFLTRFYPQYNNQYYSFNEYFPISESSSDNSFMLKSVRYPDNTERRFCYASNGVINWETDTYGNEYRYSYQADRVRVDSSKGFYEETFDSRGLVMSRKSGLHGSDVISGVEYKRESNVNAFVTEINDIVTGEKTKLGYSSDELINSIERYNAAGSLLKKIHVKEFDPRFGQPKSVDVTTGQLTVNYSYSYDEDGLIVTKDIQVGNKKDSYVYERKTEPFDNYTYAGKGKITSITKNGEQIFSGEVVPANVTQNASSQVNGQISTRDGRSLKITGLTPAGDGRFEDLQNGDWINMIVSTLTNDYSTNYISEIGYSAGGSSQNPMSLSKSEVKFDARGRPLWSYKNGLRTEYNYSSNGQYANGQAKRLVVTTKVRGAIKDQTTMNYKENGDQDGPIIYRNEITGHEVNIQ